MYTGSAWNSLYSRVRATFKNGGLHGLCDHIQQVVVQLDNVSFYPPKANAFLDLLHSKCNFHVIKDSIEICDI
jgi:hypothetical protein